LIINSIKKCFATFFFVALIKNIAKRFLIINFIEKNVSQRFF
jgi:hypothetical protein